MKERFRPEQDDIESSQDKEKKSKFKERLTQALVASGILITSGVMVEKAMNPSDEAEQSNNLDKNKTEQVSTIPEDTEKAPGDVQFVEPENSETNTANITGPDDNNPDTGVDQETNESRRVAMSHLLDEKCEQFKEKFGDTQVFVFRAVAEKGIDMYEVKNTGVDDFKVMLDTMYQEAEKELGSGIAA